MKKTTFLLIILLSFNSDFVFSQSCLPEGIYFVIQQDVNDFETNYPDCKEIEGSVEFHGSMWDLSPLGNITSIGGDLTFIDCDNLTNLQGLNDLTSVGGNFKMYDCQELTNLNELSGLSSIGGEMEINQNYNLISLYGLSSLTSIGGQLTIMSNSNMKSLAGLEAVTSIDGKILIQNNGDLLNLDGLENVDAGSISELVIIYNNDLSSCEAQSICDYLSDGSGPATIQANKPGCNSVVEVEEACLVSVPESSIAEQLSVYPNPFTNSTTIEYQLNQTSDVILTIFNKFGRQVEQINKQKQKGKQLTKWNAEGLTAGMYFYTLKSGDQLTTGKLLKID